MIGWIKNMGLWCLSKTKTFVWVKAVSKRGYFWKHHEVTVSVAREAHHVIPWCPGIISPQELVRSSFDVAIPEKCVKVYITAMKSNVPIELTFERYALGVPTKGTVLFPCKGCLD